MCVTGFRILRRERVLHGAVAVDVVSDFGTHIPLRGNALVPPGQPPAQSAYELRDGAVFLNGERLGGLVAATVMYESDFLGLQTVALGPTTVTSRTSDPTFGNSDLGTTGVSSSNGSGEERKGDTANGSATSNDTNLKGQGNKCRRRSRKSEREQLQMTGSGVDETDAEFAEWLAHHHEITGMKVPGATTKARKQLRDLFRRFRDEEDWTLEELKLATVGAFNDQWRRENGYYDHWAVLRISKVGKLVEKGKRTGTGGMTMRAREQAMRSASKTTAEQAVALWTDHIVGLCVDATTGPDSKDDIDPDHPFPPKTKAEARAALAAYGLDVDKVLASYEKPGRKDDDWVATTTGRSTAP